MCDVVTTVSNGAKALIKDDFGYTKTDIKVIRNGTDLKVQEIDKNTIKVVVFPKTYENMPLLMKGDAILVNGIIKKDEIGVSLIAEKITKMEN